MKFTLKLSVLTAGLFLTVVLLAQEENDVESRKDPGVVLARVNDEVITSYDVQVWLTMRGELDRVGSFRGEQILLQRGKAFTRALRLLINDAVIAANARLEGIKLDGSDRRKADEVFKHTLDKNLKKYGNRANFESVLKQSGLSIASIKETIEKEALKSRYKQEKFSVDTFVAPREAREYYETNKSEFKRRVNVTYRQIAIKFGIGKRSNRAARRLTGHIRAKIEEDGDFASFAKYFSEGPMKDQGGLWPSGPLSGLVEDIEQVIARLKEGEVSGVIERKSEFILIKLEKKDHEPYEPFEKALDRIAQTVLELKSEEEAPQFIQKLFSKVEIKLFLEGLKLEEICPEGAGAVIQAEQLQTTPDTAGTKQTQPEEHEK